MIICGNCGQANAENATFCSKCNAFLEWGGQRVPGATGATGGASGGPPPSGAGDRSGGAAGGDRASALVATLSQGVRSVEPGGQVVFTLDVRNVGHVVDEFRIEVLGEAAGWAEVEPPSLNLLPGTSGVVTIRIRPPHSPLARAGWVNFGVGVRSREHPEASIVERASVDIAPFVAFAVEFSPRIARGSRRATFVLKARNDGNVPLRLAVSAEDPEQALDFEFSPAALEIGPGSSRSCSVVVRARQTFSMGGARPRAFQVHVVAPGEPERAVDGTFVQTRTTSARLLAAVAAVAVVAVIGSTIALSGLGLSNAGSGTSPSVAPTESSTFAPTPEVTEPPAETATPEATETETAAPSPTLAPLSGDAVRVLAADPPVGTPLSGGQPVTFTFQLQYSLASEAQANLVVSVAQFEDTPDQCASTSGSLVVADQVQVDQGAGETTVTVTWTGAAGSGYLAPAPSLWRLGGGSRIQYFGVDPGFCYRFEP